MAETCGSVGMVKDYIAVAHPIPDESSLCVSLKVDYTEPVSGEYKQIIFTMSTTEARELAEHLCTVVREFEANWYGREH